MYGHLKKTFKIGDIVQSKMGHDTNRLYIVISVLDEFAYVADGDYRTLANPKKKRQKHLRYVGLAAISDNITDTEIKRIIKLTKSANQNQNQNQ